MDHVQSDSTMRWPVLQRRTLGEGAVSSFVNEVVETPDGSTMNRQFLTHPGAVAILAWDEETDRVVTLRQYRHPVGMQLTEIPAGLLDHRGESYLDAAKRELAEEAQLEAKRWNVLVDLLSTPGACEETLRVYLARDLAPAPLPDGFHAEHEEAQMTLHFSPRAELVAGVLNGDLGSPSLVAGILALQTAILAGGLAELRPASAPWLARQNMGL